MVRLRCLVPKEYRKRTRKFDTLTLELCAPTFDSRNGVDANAVITIVKLKQGLKGDCKNKTGTVERFRVPSSHFTLPHSCRLVSRNDTSLQ